MGVCRGPTARNRHVHSLMVDVEEFDGADWSDLHDDGHNGDQSYHLDQDAVFGSARDLLGRSSRAVVNSWMVGLSS
jgi:hypothetical protein